MSDEDADGTQYMDLGRLPELWAAVDVALQRFLALPDTGKMRVFTDRRFDEPKPAGRRPYFAAHRYITVAKDNHEALRTLMAHDGGLGPFAPWSLLRPMFEASFLALWVLDPTDSAERRRRGLNVEVYDAVEERRHVAAFEKVPQFRKAVREHQKRKQDSSEAAYRAEAAAMNLQWDQLQRPVNVVDGVKRLRFVRGSNDPMMPAFFESTWRLLSGFEHGLGWALLRGSDEEHLAEIPGGVSVSLSVNDETFTQVAGGTYVLMLRAIDMFVRRHTKI